LAIEPDVRFLNAWRWALELEFRLAGLPAGRTLIAGEDAAVRFAPGGRR
jgi:hypothetical protein